MARKSAFAALAVTVFLVLAAFARAHAVSNLPPTFVQIPDVVVNEGDGTHVTITATDADSDILSLTLAAPPSFVELVSVTATPGRVDGFLRVAPTAQDAGEYTIRILCSDGDLTSTYDLGVTVRNGNMPPAIESEFVIAAPMGVVTDHTVIAHDFDPQVVTISLVSGPTFVTLGPTRAVADVYEATMHIAPAATDVGDWPVRIDASDQIAVTETTHWVHVYDPSQVRPPTIDSIPDLALAEGEVVRRTVTARDVDGDYIRLDVLDSPAFVRFEIPPWDCCSDPGLTSRTLRIAPGPNDAGDWEATVVASEFPYTGSDFQTRETFRILVRGALPARAFQAPEETPIVLRSARPTVTLWMEAVGDRYSPEDLVPASLCLWSPGHGETDSIFAQEAKGSRIEDRDRNGVPELGAVFAKEDIQRLFASVHGRRTIQARLQGNLLSGTRVLAPIDLEVLGAPANNVAIWPNPLNPRGTISFQASHSGRAVVRLYDVNGRLVRTLLDGNVGVGEVLLPFDGFDSHGRALGSGVYFYRVTTGDGEWRGRATILK